MRKRTQKLSNIQILLNSKIIFGPNQVEIRKLDHAGWTGLMACRTVGGKFIVCEVCAIKVLANERNQAKKKHDKDKCKKTQTKGFARTI